MMLCYRISHRVFHVTLGCLCQCPRYTAPDAALLLIVWTGVESWNSHVLSVALGDLVSDGILVRQVFIVEEVVPALRLIEISNLS